MLEYKHPKHWTSHRSPENSENCENEVDINDHDDKVDVNDGVVVRIENTDIMTYSRGSSLVFFDLDLNLKFKSGDSTMATMTMTYSRGRRRWSEY